MRVVTGRDELVRVEMVRRSEEWNVGGCDREKGWVRIRSVVPPLYDYQEIQCFVFKVKTNERALLIAFFDEATTTLEAVHSLSTASGVCLGVFGGGVSTHNLFGFASLL